MMMRLAADDVEPQSLPAGIVMFFEEVRWHGTIRWMRLVSVGTRKFAYSASGRSVLGRCSSAHVRQASPSSVRPRRWRIFNYTLSTTRLSLGPPPVRQWWADGDSTRFTQNRYSSDLAGFNNPYQHRIGHFRYAE